MTQNITEMSPEAATQFDNAAIQEMCPIAQQVLHPIILDDFYTLPQRSVCIPTEGLLIPYAFVPNPEAGKVGIACAEAFELICLRNGTYRSGFVFDVLVGNPSEPLNPQIMFDLSKYYRTPTGLVKCALQINQQAKDANASLIGPMTHNSWFIPLLDINQIVRKVKEKYGITKFLDPQIQSLYGGNR